MDGFWVTTRPIDPTMSRRRHRLRRLDVIERSQNTHLPDASHQNGFSLRIRQASPDIADTTDGTWNRLWLLFLIPVVFAACVIILAVWFFHRRRRQKRARSSALRNVTLVIQDEEKAREKEDRRLSRANSTMSKLARRNSSVQVAREKRYSERVSQAIAEEEKTRLPEEDDKGIPSVEEQSPSLYRALSDAAKDPLKRKASVKHRDREVAERVWRVAGEDMGDTPLPIVAAHPRHLDKALEDASPGPSAPPKRTSSLKRHRLSLAPDAAQKEDMDESMKEAEGPSVVREGYGRRDSDALSAIGEISVSEDKSGAATSRDGGIDSVAALALAPIASPSHEQMIAVAKANQEVETVSTPIQDSSQGRALLSTPIRPSEANWLSRSNSQLSSNRSGYMSATSHIRSSGFGESNLMSDDQRSLRTAEELAVVTTSGGISHGSGGHGQSTAKAEGSSPAPVKEGLADFITAPALHGADVESGGESAITAQSSNDPFRSPTSPSVHGANKDPFASPTRSSHGHQPPLPSAAGQGARDGLAGPVVPAIITTVASPGDDDATPVAQSSSLDPDTRKWTDVIKLKAPLSGRRNRSASPSRASTPQFARLQGSSNLTRSSSAKSAGHGRQSRLVRGSHGLQKTHSLSTVKADRLNTGIAPDGADVRRASSSSAAHWPSDTLGSGSWTYTSRAAEWRANAALSDRDPSRREAQRCIDSAAREADSSSTNVGQPVITDALTISQTESRPLERKPSIGVAGSRFLEGFE